MKRSIAILALAVLFLGQMPAPVHCQMGFALPGISHMMDCCSSKTAPLRCPQVRTTLQKEAVAPSTVSVPAQGLQVLHIVKDTLSQSPLLKNRLVRQAAHFYQAVFLISPRCLRAPPTDSMSVSA